MEMNHHQNIRFLLYLFINCIIGSMSSGMAQNTSPEASLLKTQNPEKRFTSAVGTMPKRETEYTDGDWLNAYHIRPTAERHPEVNNIFLLALTTGFPKQTSPEFPYNWKHPKSRVSSVPTIGSVTGPLKTAVQQETAVYGPVFGQEYFPETRQRQHSQDPEETDQSLLKGKFRETSPTYPFGNRLSEGRPDKVSSIAIAELIKSLSVLLRQPRLDTHGDMASKTDRRRTKHKVLPTDFTKRTQLRTRAHYIYTNRPFDRIAGDLIGKRAMFMKKISLKRQFGSVPDAIVTKTAPMKWLRQLYAKRPFYSLANGLTGK